jgi:chemotaxis protein CheX
MEQYIQPFISVCETVFHDFCQTEVKADRVFFMKKDEYESNWDISGIIGLSGEATGAVVISLKDLTAYRVTDALTGTKHTSLDADVTDAVEEIINIIAGNVKKYFEEGMRIKISLPSIVKGTAHSIVWPSEKNRIICILFSIFEKQEICLSIAMDGTK